MELPDLSDPNNKKKASIIGGVAIVLIALVIGSARFTRAPRETGGTMPPFVVQPASTKTASESSMGVADTSDLDRLMDIFGGVKANPAAQAFAQEFLAKPELKDIWDEFNDQNDEETEDDEDPSQNAKRRTAPKMTLAALAAELSEKGEFRALVSRFNQEPGFRDALVRLARNPEIKRIMQDTIARSEAGASAAANRGRTATYGAVGGKAAFSHGMRDRAALARGGGMTGSDVRVAGGGSGAAAQTAGAAAPRAARAEPSQIAGLTPQTSQGQANMPPGQNAAALDAHEVTPGLEGAANVGGDTDLGWLASLCNQDRSPPPELGRDGCQSLTNELANRDCTTAGDCLWAACFNINRFDDCLAVCRQHPTQCVARNYWQTCVDVLDPQKCTDLCKDRGGSECPTCGGMKCQCGEDAEGNPKMETLYSCVFNCRIVASPGCGDATPNDSNAAKTACEARKPEGKRCYFRPKERTCECYKIENTKALDGVYSNETSRGCKDLDSELPNRTCTFNAVNKRCNCYPNDPSKSDWYQKALNDCAADGGTFNLKWRRCDKN